MSAKHVRADGVLRFQCGEKSCIVMFNEVPNDREPVCEQCCFRGLERKSKLLGIISCSSLPVSCSGGYYTLIDEILENL